MLSNILLAAAVLSVVVRGVPLPAGENQAVPVPQFVLDYGDYFLSSSHSLKQDSLLTIYSTSGLAALSRKIYALRYIRSTRQYTTTA
jgi:hypothetical protein